MRQTSPTLQLVLSLLGALALFTGALLFLLFGAVQLFAPDQVDPAPSFLWAGSLFFSALLVLPSAYFALQGIRGRPARWNADTRWVTGLSMFLLLVVLPFILLLGHWISSNPRISWLLLPPLHVLAVGIPVFWMGSLALRNLPIGSPRRFWGILAASLTATPFSILVVELFAMSIAVGAAILYLSTQPELAAKLQELFNNLRNAVPNEQALQDLIEPLASNPTPILMVVGFVSIVVPLVEETLKPMAVWLLAPRGISPAEGFALGAVCGTAYALFESLFLATAGQGWSMVVIARIGTAALHILTTALTGWGLALAWGQQAPRADIRRLALLYGTAVFIHAAWNALTTLNTVSVLIPQDTPDPAARLIQAIGAIAPYGLVALFVGCFAALLVLNRRLASPTATDTSALDLGPLPAGPEAAPPPPAEQNLAKQDLAGQDSVEYGPAEPDTEKLAGDSPETGSPAAGLPEGETPGEAGFASEAGITNDANDTLSPTKKVDSNGTDSLPD